MALERISEEQSISIDSKVWFSPFMFSLSLGRLDELRRARFVTLADQPLALIDLKAGMQTQDCWIGVSVGR